MREQQDIPEHFRTVIDLFFVGLLIFAAVAVAVIARYV